MNEQLFNPYNLSNPNNLINGTDSLIRKNSATDFSNNVISNNANTGAIDIDTSNNFTLENNLRNKKISIVIIAVIVFILIFVKILEYFKYFSF